MNPHKTPSFHYQVTTDGHDSYPRAIRETLGNAVIHRCNHSLNNRLEQDHRGGRTTLLPQVRGVAKGDVGGQVMLIAKLFGVAA